MVGTREGKVILTLKTAVISRTADEIPVLMEQLGADDGARRQEARDALVQIGRAAAPHVTRALADSNARVRWKAAKALRDLREPSSALSLVEPLMDETLEVRWLAAEALVTLEEKGIVPFLAALVRNFGSIWLRNGAYHVLYALEMKQLLNPETSKVLKTLRSIQPAVSVAYAAH
jgi:HEAT repeat protein